MELFLAMPVLTSVLGTSSPFSTSLQIVVFLLILLSYVFRRLISNLNQKDAVRVLWWISSSSTDMLMISFASFWRIGAHVSSLLEGRRSFPSSFIMLLCRRDCDYLNWTKSRPHFLIRTVSIFYRQLLESLDWLILRHDRRPFCDGRVDTLTWFRWSQLLYHRARWSP